MHRCDVMKQLEEKMAEHNTRFSYCFSHDPKTSKMDTTLLISTEKIESKKREKPIIVFPWYCPFCGESTQEKSA